MARRKKTNLFGHKGENGRAWKRFLAWAFAVLGALLVLGVIAWFRILAYMQGESFRHTLESHLAEQFQAQRVGLHSSLHIDGERVNEEGLTVEKAGALRSAKAGRISMELERAALLSRRLNIRKVSVEEAELVFEQNEEPKEQKKGKTPKKRKKGGTVSGSAALAPAAPAADKKGFFSLQGWNMDLLECKDTELTYRRKGEDYSLQGCTVTTTPLKKGGWQYTAENGRLHTPLAMLRGASVRTASVQQDAGGLNLSDCRIMLYPGEMRVRAHQEAASQKWSANIALNKASVALLLSEDWKKRVSGELYGKVTLTGDHGGLTAGEGTLSLQGGVLEALPFLSDLPGEGGYPYRRLELEKAECRLSFPYAAPEHNISEAWLFDNINIRSKNGLLRVHGHVVVGMDGALSGTLTIGVPTSVLSSLPTMAMLQSLFNVPGEAGYQWLNINLSGTVDEPVEDLSVRCASLMQNALPAAAEKAAATAEQMFRLLLSAPKPAPKAGEDAGAENTLTPADAVNAAAEGVQQGLNDALKLFF